MRPRGRAKQIFGGCDDWDDIPCGGIVECDLSDDMCVEPPELLPIHLECPLTQVAMSSARFLFNFHREHRGL